MAIDDETKKNKGDNDRQLSVSSAMPGESSLQSVNRITPTKDSYWFAHGGKDEVASPNYRNVKTPENAKDVQLQKEREERIRIFREQQEGERIKRMHELEQSFVSARKFREQQEDERKRKIEEAKIRENERRQQVEERKRLIWEAEKERKGAILRRNLDREARIEARRNAHRNSASFAFGSSAPRTFDLDLAALGRNAAVGCPLMSAVSGKRLDDRDFGTKRATSACSLDRRSGDDCMSWSVTSLSSASRGRRRTDLTPSVTMRERSVTPNATPRAKDYSRSPSRPQSSMSVKSEVSVSSSQASSTVVLRPKPAPRKPRPISIAGTTVERPAWNTSSSSVCPPVKPPRAKSSEPENKPTSVKKPVPPPKSAQVLAKAKSHAVPTKDNLRKIAKVPKESEKTDILSEPQVASSTETQSTSDQAKPVPPKKPERVKPPSSKQENNSTVEIISTETTENFKLKIAVSPDVSAKVSSVPSNEVATEINTAVNAGVEQKPEVENKPTDDVKEDETGGDAIAKPRITSEEEAKAALAEKRRLAREQAEREAEMEQLRLEELRRQEEERQKQEELEQKRQEEEQIRLAEIHRKMEEEKLRKAIEEQKQREKEEEARREEEARLKAEKDEQERKAKEEAEKQRLELAEKLQKEEQERAERKRRVEQIMSRTRGKGVPQPDDASTNKEPATDTVPTFPSGRAVNSEVSSDSNVISSNSNSYYETSLESVGNSVNPSVSSTIVMQESVQSQSAGRATAGQFDVDFLMRNSDVKNGFHSDKVEQTYLNTNGVNGVPNWTLNEDPTASMQTNGYSSHEESSLMSSPEERSEKSDSSGLLLDLQPTQNAAATNVMKGQMEFNQLIDFGTGVTTTNSHNNNYTINADLVNSNLTSEDPFHTYDDNLPKKRENTITDLLS